MKYYTSVYIIVIRWFSFEQWDRFEKMLKKLEIFDPENENIRLKFWHFILYVQPKQYIYSSLYFFFDVEQS